MSLAGVSARGFPFWNSLLKCPRYPSIAHLFPQSVPALYRQNSCFGVWREYNLVRRSAHPGLKITLACALHALRYVPYRVLRIGFCLNYLITVKLVMLPETLSITRHFHTPAICNSTSRIDDPASPCTDSTYLNSPKILSPGFTGTGSLRPLFHGLANGPDPGPTDFESPISLVLRLQPIEFSPPMVQYNTAYKETLATPLSAGEGPVPSEGERLSQIPAI